jgi:hypothetical protein
MVSHPSLRPIFAGGLANSFAAHFAATNWILFSASGGPSGFLPVG